MPVVSDSYTHTLRDKAHPQFRIDNNYEGGQTEAVQKYTRTYMS